MDMLELPGTHLCHLVRATHSPSTAAEPGAVPSCLCLGEARASKRLANAHRHGFASFAVCLRLCAAVSAACPATHTAAVPIILHAGTLRAARLQKSDCAQHTLHQLAEHILAVVACLPL